MQELTTWLAAATLAVLLTMAGSPSAPPAETGVVPCVNGMAGDYPCRNVNLLAHLTLADLGAQSPAVKANEHWGWIDPVTGREFVIFGLTNATAFVDISDPANPVYLGQLPSHQGVSTYRDFAISGSYLFVVADSPAQHGLQVFDLTDLRAASAPPVTFTEAAHYAGFVAGHSLWMNEATGFLYVFRTVGDGCGSGVQVVNVQDPLHPSFAGCFGGDQAPLSTGECLLYDGPDADYTGREICFVASDDNVTIVDVSNKSQPVTLADFDYPDIARAHQGDLTADLRYWVMSDMMDEHHYGYNTRTYAFDIADLDDPVVLGHFANTTHAIDHDIILIGVKAFQANWRAGLRILDIRGLPDTGFRELGYFDTVPGSDSVEHTGAFSPYPLWSGGVVTVSDTESGLFVLQPVVDRLYLPMMVRGSH